MPRFFSAVSHLYARGSRSWIVAGAILALSAPPAFALTAEQKCQDGIALHARNYFKARYKAIAKCEGKKSKGSLDQSVNCRPADGPVTDARTDTAITRADDKLRSRIQLRCATVDIASLPFGLPCEQETTVNDLVDCIINNAHGANADMLIESAYDESGQIPDTQLRGCQKTIQKESMKYARLRMTRRRVCDKKFIIGKIDGTCPNAKTHQSFAKDRAKFINKILLKCTDAQVTDELIDFGFPCEAFQSVTFDRDGATNNNLMPPNERLARCMAAAAAGTGDLGEFMAYPLPDPSPFSFGEAAGDATDTSFVAWARTENAVPDVTIEVATDANFSSIVHTDTLSPDAAADNTVKTDVTGLSPGTQYFYRFTQGGDTSRTGRVRTAPAAASTDAITFAWTGDSNAFFKPYAVLEGITADDPDLWLYIGDTIYGDDPRSGSGVAANRSDYHDKYKENRSDRPLRDLMASVGTVTTWDDHEVENDFYGTNPDAGFQTLMADGNQAFRDYMPIREDGGDPMKLFRQFQWGQAAEFFLIDVRQYRDSQAYVTEPTCNEGECDVTGDPCSTQADCDAIQPGQTCINIEPLVLPTSPACLAEIADPGRTYLGATQLAWLKSGLLNSPATFKFVMNGPIITSLLFVPFDRWEGYAAERQDLLDFIANNNIKNVFFLSTDIHALILSESVGAGTGVREYISGAIGMDPIFRELPPAVLILVDLLPSLFGTVSYFDIDRFNYGIATVTTADVTFEFKDNTGGVLKTVVIDAE